MTEGQRLSQYVGREATERELTDQWEHIEARLGTKRTSGSLRAVMLAALAIVALAGTALFIHRVRTPSAWDGAVVDSGADHVSVALGDGSRIELLPASQVKVIEGSARSVRLDLHRGSAHFDVTHVAGRTFSVKSGNVTIRVVGTRFSVSTTKLPDGQRVTVAVDEGVVEAESGGAEPTRIRAGETWTTEQHAEPSVVTPRAEASVVTPKAEPSVAAVDPSPKAAVEPASPASPALERAPGVAERVTKPEPSAQELFESANGARQGGDARGAAASYEALLRHYPGDARAGLAAFELGRLKMDQLGDTRGAVQALQRAVTGAPGSAFREDALARLARAYGTLGRTESCERTRRAYLESYPNGVHASAVRQACGNAP